MTDSLVIRLKAKLKRSLHKHVGEAVNDVCDDFIDELKPVEPWPAAPTMVSNGGDVDYECCRRLVEYIVRNMETSPGFAQQMDCVILAYQSSASIDVLNSVVAQNLWIRRKIGGGGVVNDVSAHQTVAQQKKIQSKQDFSPTPRDTKASIIGENTACTRSPAPGLEDRTTATKVDSVRVDRGSANFSNLEAQTSTTVTSRSRPREWGTRNRLVTSKRQRIAVTRSNPSHRTQMQSLPSDRRYSMSDNSEDKQSSIPQQMVALNTDATDAAARDKSDVAKPADDPIAKFCCNENWTADETRIFKTHLRDTISIVDALLCKPPRGHICSRHCKVIRAQMCNELTPCINPTCRVWHEAEAHNDNCSNVFCEFKTRVHLRETLHIIEHKRQEIADAQESLQVTSHSNKKETSVKQNASLKQNLEILNTELISRMDTKLDLWSILSVIGIDTNSDQVDSIPDFASHYVPRNHTRT
ncbi:hypothetical protein PHMEG_00018754 [Phytophthora megakarya]|uniref:Uncharacterized protein n=1 Tax=Phytophthora megakarya TaxID=4795 RepID=A0A225VU44_9STRA|nr:hypothetical protein PHMEG_00018754 [Phytophthora megakarya]